jgi:hypothetical protein
MLRKRNERQSVGGLKRRVRVTERDKEIERLLLRERKKERQ